MNTLYSFLSGIIICSLLNMTSILKSTVDEINELREHNENIILLRQYEANESSPLHNVTASDSEGGK
ncbi:hypothetical protein [Shewanella ulleungensis]|uniref:hypothetical protein n=1 Tax=Shewanella ulleungensis TaxID=2282699 RepID=UPI003D78EC28